MKILICGAGALGSNLVANLVADLRGEHNITVLDKDVVAERNIQAGTQFYFIDQVGQLKVEALQYNIYKWFEREIQILNVFLNVGNMYSILDNYDLIIDCFDNKDGRRTLQSFWEDSEVEKNPQVLHAGFSRHFTFAIEWAKSYLVPEDISSKFDICEMEGASSFVKMVSALTSSVVQEFVRSDRKVEMIGNRTSFIKMSVRQNRPLIDSRLRESEELDIDAPDLSPRGSRRGGIIRETYRQTTRRSPSLFGNFTESVSAPVDLRRMIREVEVDTTESPAPRRNRRRR